MAEATTRIYQGRVIKVLIEEKNSEAVEVQNGDELLFGHHAIYQDAVNYYLVALTAMSSKDSELLGKMRQSLEKVWNDFYCEGESGKRPGLKHSIIRCLEKDFPGEVDALMRKDGLDHAMKLIVGSNNVPQEILNAALELVVSKCQGDVVQPGRTYFPRLCRATYSGNWDFDTKALKESEGKRRLINALFSDNPVANIKKIIPEMTLGWSGVKTQNGKYFEGIEANKSLKDAISFFIETKPEKLGQRVSAYLEEKGKEELKAYLKLADDLKDISFDRNNKADPRLRNATWLLKFFPTEYTVGLIKSILPEKNVKSENDGAGNELPFGDDPVKLSRGNRNYVFKSFTDLKIWSSGDLPKEEPGWRNRFDIAAFCETLKTLNQFRQKTEERNQKHEAYRAALEWMDGKSSAKNPPKNPESDMDEEDEINAGLPVLNGDPRWTALQKMLKQDLAISNEFTEDDFVEYGLTKRTIRSYSELKDKMLRVESDARKKGLDDKALSALLLDAVMEFQDNHRETIGSATLYRKLTEPEFFCIWHDALESRKHASSDILRDAVLYYEFQETYRRFQETIMVTPADVRYSRRTSDLRMLVYDKAGYQKGFGHVKENVFNAKIARKTPEGISSVKVQIQYSAPRLKRDGLIGGETSVYASPLLRAFLGDDMPSPKQDFKSTAVSLMPDWDRKDKLRSLLNFPVRLDVSTIVYEPGARFANQFERQKNNSEWIDARLLWYPKNGRAVTWNKDGQPFDFLSVDLGQRVAAAVSRVHASLQPDPRLHPVLLGEIDGRKWYATRNYSGLLRLPGEDSTVIRGGKREKEPSGRSGRPATKEETADVLDICDKLIGDTSLIFQYDKVTPVASFPEQNDRLLIALRRALWRLKQLSRWHRMLKNSAKREQAEAEISSVEWLPGGKDLESIRVQEQEMRADLPGLLLRIADRILPLRGRKWEWIELPETKSFRLRQTAPGSDDPRKRICGQRGLSMARIEQLEILRKRCQGLNRVLMDAPGAPLLTPKQRREQQIPDCCPDILMRMNEMKEQRVNQTANMILAQALGLRLRPHVEDAAKRAENGIHGEYERIPGASPCSFIVLENLSRYRFSQDRTTFENSRLMKWSHRQILAKLKMLCEVFNIPVLEVDAKYSSKFSPSGFPGFRAVECGMAELNRIAAGKLYRQGRAKDILDGIRRKLDAMLAVNGRATVILPRAGGPVFVPFVPAENSDVLTQADENASFNIGLRGVASPFNFFVNNIFSARKEAAGWTSRTLGKKLVIQFAPDFKVEGRSGRFFVIRCSPGLLQKQGDSPDSRPRFADSVLNEVYPNLLFGAAIWRDLPLQLERCRKINQARLEKLTRSQGKS